MKKILKVWLLMIAMVITFGFSGFLLTRSGKSHPKEHFSKVVIVYTTKKIPSDTEKKHIKGTGFFFIEEDLIVCSAHGFASLNDSVWIQNRDSTISLARIAWMDTLRDIAFVRTASPNDAYFSYSSTEYMANEVIYAIGNLQGIYSWSIIYGFWTAGNPQETLMLYELFSAPGMSGSPVINQKNELQGMLKGSPLQDQNSGSVIPAYWIYQKYLKLKELER